jgi:hypothetical protein
MTDKLTVAARVLCRPSHARVVLPPDPGAVPEPVLIVGLVTRPLDAPL